VTAIPFITGSAISMMAMSGLDSMALPVASLPSAASATTSKSDLVWTIRRTPGANHFRAVSKEEADH
jgi:hypothetical protein